MKNIRLRWLVLCIMVSIATSCQVILAQNPVDFIKEGNLKKIEKFVSNGGDLSATYQYMRDDQKISGFLLNYAYAMNQEVIFEWLIEKSKNQSNYMDQINSCLTLFVGKGDLTNLKRFIEQGADINAVCDYCSGSNPLLQALGNQNLEIINFLLSLNPDMNAVDKENRGILHYAASGGHYELFVKFVEEDGFDIWRLHPEKSVLFFAVNSGNFKLIEYIVNRMESDIERDVEGRYNYPEPDENGNTLLHYATEQGFEIFQLLISFGIDRFMKNDDGYNLLHSACEVGNTEIVKFLLSELIFDVNEQTYEDGFNPMLLAISSGNFEIVKMLYEHENFTPFYSVDGKNDEVYYDYKKMALKLARETDKNLYKKLKGLIKSHPRSK